MKKSPVLKLLFLTVCLWYALSASAYDFYTYDGFFNILDDNTVELTNDGDDPGDSYYGNQ